MTKVAKPMWDEAMARLFMSSAKRRGVSGELEARTAYMVCEDLTENGLEPSMDILDFVVQLAKARARAKELAEKSGRPKRIVRITIGLGRSIDPHRIRRMEQARELKKMSDAAERARKKKKSRA
jgi:hypothetical protein